MQEFLISVLGALLILGGFTGLIIWMTWPQDAIDTNDDEAGWG